MATLTLNLTSIVGAVSNVFIAKFLDARGSEITVIPQNQVVTVASLKAPQKLTFNLPDGNYKFPYIKVRLYSGSLISNVYSDYVRTNLSIDCGGNPDNSASTTTASQQTTLNIATTSTTVGGHKCQCNGVDTFSIVVSDSQNGIQFVSAYPIQETRGNQTTTGTHRVAFASCGAIKLVWYVFVNGGGIVRTGTINPQANTFLINLADLPIGSYGFSLTSVYENGLGCTGSSIVTFNITQQNTTTVFIPGNTTTLSNGTASLNAAFGSFKNYSVVEGKPTSTNLSFLNLSTEMLSSGRYRVINSANNNTDANYKDVYRINGIPIYSVQSNSITGNINDQVGSPLASPTFVEKATVLVGNNDPTTWFDVRTQKPGTQMSQGTIIRFRRS